MALVNIGGFDIPAEWLYGGLGTFFVLIGLLTFVLLRGRGKPSKDPSPVEQQLVLDVPIDEHGTIQMGRLISGAQLQGTDLTYPDPDSKDPETGEPGLNEAPAEKKQPFPFMDEDGVVNKLWVVASRGGGEKEVVSASVIVKGLPQRFDPIEADPRQVGRLYVGWGGTRLGGLSQFVQSTTGKVLVIGASLLMGYLLGVITIAAHVGHF